MKPVNVELHVVKSGLVTYIITTSLCVVQFGLVRYKKQNKSDHYVIRCLNVHKNEINLKSVELKINTGRSRKC